MTLMTRLESSGRRWLEELSTELEDADPGGLVSPRSRLLCAALGELAANAARALGASDDEAGRAGVAGAALSLLTKIDDEVIDALGFHGGPRSPRDVVEERTRAFLAPTLRALVEGARSPWGSDPTEEGRCRLARSVGRRFAALATDARRLDRLLSAIQEGWEVQVSAAKVLTAHPDDVSLAEVERATRSISGAWLAMVTLVGGLPSGAARTLHESEIEAVWDFGSFIQRADALCDLEKDQRDGLVSTFVAHQAFTAARARGVDPDRLFRDTASVYRLVVDARIDLDCVPDEEARAKIRAALVDLGEVEPLLSWIFAMLFGRYLAHPLSARQSMAPFTTEVATCSAH